MTRFELGIGSYELEPGICETRSSISLTIYDGHLYVALSRATIPDGLKPIPFRRRVFPSCLDGKHITGKNVEDFIKSKSFKKLDDDDALSLCCIGIWQLVLLDLEDRRAVPNWILSDANVKRWLSLYATESINEDDKKLYSIMGFTWAFKLLKVFRLGWNEYYTRHMRYPRVVAWTSNKNFYRYMLRNFLHGRVPVERLIPDEVEAGLGWWLSSRAYFDGCVTKAEQRPRHLNCQNHYEPSSSNWQSQMPAYTPSPNWQPPILFHPGDAGLCYPNKLERPRRKQRHSVYMRSPYMPLPPTMELPKKRVGGDDVVITGVHDTGINFTYENVDPNKVYMPINVGGNHQKQIQKDRGRQLVIMNLGHQFDNAITAKDKLWKAYEECRDIPREQRALTTKFLKIESELDQQMQNALFRKAPKLEKQIRDKNKLLFVSCSLISFALILPELFVTSHGGSVWMHPRIARLLQDKMKAKELTKDKIEAEKVPHFKDHVSPHIIQPKVFVMIQLCVDVLTISVRDASIAAYPYEIY
nr:phospholipase-like protein [Tanacetum cinerariifolium]